MCIFTVAVSATTTAALAVNSKKGERTFERTVGVGDTDAGFLYARIIHSFRFSSRSFATIIALSNDMPLPSCKLHLCVLACARARRPLLPIRFVIPPPLKFTANSSEFVVSPLLSPSPLPRCRHHLVSFLALASEILTCTARKRRARARAQGKITALSSFHRAPSLRHYSNRSPNTLPTRMRNKVPRARVSFSLSPFPVVFLSLSCDCSFIICRRRHRRRWRGPLFTRARSTLHNI